MNIKKTSTKIFELIDYQHFFDYKTLCDTLSSNTNADINYKIENQFIKIESTIPINNLDKVIRMGKIHLINNCCNINSTYFTQQGKLCKVFEDYRKIAIISLKSKTELKALTKICTHYSESIKIAHHVADLYYIVSSKPLKDESIYVKIKYLFFSISNYSEYISPVEEFYTNFIEVILHHNSDIPYHDFFDCNLKYFNKILNHFVDSNTFEKVDVNHFELCNYDNPVLNQFTDAYYMYKNTNLNIVFCVGSIGEKTVIVKLK